MMTYSLIIKGTQDDAIKALASRRLIHRSEFEATSHGSQQVYVATHSDRKIVDWFNEEQYPPFPAGSLLLFTRVGPRAEATD